MEKVGLEVNKGVVSVCLRDDGVLIDEKRVEKNTVNSSETRNGKFSYLFYLLHQNGDKLYPVRMKNRDTGKIAFRVSKGGTGGNTKEVGMEIDDEHLMKRYVLEQGYAVRAATLNRSREGLYKVDQRSIIRAVDEI